MAGLLLIDNSMAFNRSFLKWAGSKYNCLGHIIASLLPARRLIEPFAGSGVVGLNSNYSSYIYGETNPDLISIFTILQHHGEDFVNYCQQFFLPEFNCKERYYELRAQFNSLSHSELRSALFLYLNRHGYNGLCRYNSKGIYNVPFGRYSKSYFPLKEMRHFLDKCHNMHFIAGDFRDTFQLAEVGDIIYCDPPYVSLFENSQRFAYTKNKFEDLDQTELALLAIETSAKGIPVIISNHDTQFTRNLYKRAKIKSFSVSRYINCQPDMRQPVKELIAIFK